MRLKQQVIQECFNHHSCLLQRLRHRVHSVASASSSCWNERLEEEGSKERPLRHLLDVKLHTGQFPLDTRFTTDQISILVSYTHLSAPRGQVRESSWHLRRWRKHISGVREQFDPKPTESGGIENNGLGFVISQCRPSLTRQTPSTICSREGRLGRAL